MSQEQVITGKDQNIEYTNSGNLSEAHRDGAMAAVRKALADAEANPEASINDEIPEVSLSEDGEVIIDGTAEKKAPAEETSKSKFSRLIKAREQAHKVRQDAQSEVAKEREEAKAMRAEAESQLAKLKEQSAFLEQLRSNPVEALRAMGIAPEDAITRIAREGTPEGELDRWKEAQSKELLELRRWRENQEATYKKQQEQMSMQAEQQRRSNIENTYLTSIKDESKYPNTLMLWGDDRGELLTKGHWAADVARDALGRAATLDEICEFLEEQATIKVSKLSGRKAKPDLGKSDQGGKALPAKGTSGHSKERSPTEQPNGESSWDKRRLMADAAVRTVARDRGIVK